MVTDMQVILPASAPLELADSGDVRVSWIQVAKTGVFYSSRYGKFEISSKMLSQMYENSLGSANKLMIDYDHLSLNPQQPEQAKAAGWFQRLELRSGGRELWGLVEWTPRAAELISNKEYQYISPTFVKSYKSKETNVDVGAKLLCAAITNHPFLEDMAPLQLAEVSMTDLQQRVHTAFAKKFNDGLQPVAYIVDFFNDYLVCRKHEDGRLYRVDFSVTEDLEVTFSGEPAEVVATYELVKQAQNNGETSMADNAQDIVKLSEQVTSLNDQIVSLTQALATEKAAREQAQHALAAERATQEVAALVADGRLLPVQKDWAVKYALSNPAEFKEFAATLKPAIDLNKEHGTAAAQGGHKAESDDPVVSFNAAIEEHIKAGGGHGKVRYSDALRAVSLSDPDLAQRYREALNGAQ